MDSKKYYVWTYYTYNKPTDERFYIKISFGVLIFLGIVLIILSSSFELGEIKANLVVLGLLLIFIGVIFFSSSFGKTPKSNDEIIYAYVYSYDAKTLDGTLYILNMWSNEFLNRTGLQAYGRKMSVNHNIMSKMQEVNNENRRRIVDTVRRYNLIEKLISEDRFVDIAIPMTRVTGIKVKPHSVRVYYSYFLKQKQKNTSFVVRDNIENFETLVECLKAYVHKKTTCCSWCGCIMIKGKCVVCGDTNGIKVPTRISYYLKSVGAFFAGLLGIYINQNIEEQIVITVIALLIIYAFSYSIETLVNMNKCVR